MKTKLATAITLAIVGVAGILVPLTLARPKELTVPDSSDAKGPATAGDSSKVKYAQSGALAGPHKAFSSPDGLGMGALYYVSPHAGAAPESWIVLPYATEVRMEPNPKTGATDLAHSQGSSSRTILDVSPANPVVVGTQRWTYILTPVPGKTWLTAEHGRDIDVVCQPAKQSDPVKDGK
jgi:hypothetical protein